LNDVWTDIDVEAGHQEAAAAVPTVRAYKNHERLNATDFH